MVVSSVFSAMQKLSRSAKLSKLTEQCKGKQKTRTPIWPNGRKRKEKKPSKITKTQETLNRHQAPNYEIDEKGRYLDSWASSIVANAWRCLGFGFAWVSTIFEISRCARARIASCSSPSAFASSPDGPAAASLALSGCIDTIPLPNAECERLQEAATNRAREREMIQ